MFAGPTGDGQPIPTMQIMPMTVEPCKSAADASAAVATTKTSPGRPAKVKALYGKKSTVGKHSKAAGPKRTTSPSKKLASSSLIRFKSKSGPTKTNPWSIAAKRINRAEAPGVASTEVKLGPQGPEIVAKEGIQANALEELISGMDAKEAIRAKVGDFGIYLVKTDFTALRPESWITGSVIMIFLQHAKQAAMDRTRTVSALGVQLQHTFLATADLFDSMCTDQQMTKRVNEWWTDKVSCIKSSCILVRPDPSFC